MKLKTLKQAKSGGEMQREEKLSLTTSVPPAKDTSNRKPSFPNIVSKVIGGKKNYQLKLFIPSVLKMAIWKHLMGHKYHVGHYCEDHLHFPGFLLVHQLHVGLHCEKCNVGFQTFAEFEVHQRQSHTQLVDCTTCGKTLKKVVLNRLVD